MLVLSRKVGEEIVIGKGVIVRVARVSQDRAFLAIEAPRDVPVDREEIRFAKNRKLRVVGSCEVMGQQTGPGEMRQS